MSGRKKIVLSVGVVLIVLAAVAVGWYMGASNKTGTQSAANQQAGSPSPAAPASSTREAVPQNVVVPNKGATSTPTGVAVPAAQGPGDTAGNVSYRSFNISIQNGAFSPDTVIVKEGDTVNLEITAVDGNYDFTQPDYGFSDPIAKGKTQTIQFQALQTGNFTFYCASCGGPSSGPVGHLIVAPK
jgi:plastocyanin